MDKLLSKIDIRVNKSVYKKDPRTSKLGQKIVRNSVDLIVELGFEEFTFKKLAAHIDSTEASVYRYFENKHNMLAYLTIWYWGWMDYKVLMATLNIENPHQKLRNAIKMLTQEVVEDRGFSLVNEAKLHQIIIQDASKVYLCKQVEMDDEHGFFSAYKDVVKRVADIILEIRADFKYPNMLVSTIIEGAHHQRYFAEHLPRLTDVVEGEDAVTSFYVQLVEREIGIEGK